MDTIAFDPQDAEFGAFKKGGLIEAQTGTLVPVQQPSATFSRINPETGLPETTAAPASATPQVLQPGTPAPITTGSALTPTTLSALTPTGTRVSAPDRPVGQQPPTTTPLPTGQQFLGGAGGTNFFINELGQVIQIPVINGRQIYDEPKGFQPYDPSNPTPFDPTLEDDSTVTDPEQPPQRRRTVTDREEGGQPDVGFEGADLPGTDPEGLEGLGLGSLGAVNSAVDAINELDEPNIDQINSVLDTYSVTIGDIEGYGKIPGIGIIGALVSAAANAATKGDREKANVAIAEAVATAREEGTRAGSISSDKSRPGIRGFSPAPGVPGGPAGGVNTGPASPFSGISDDTAAQFGGDAAADAASASASADAEAAAEAQAESMGFGTDSMWEKGGLISPRLHRKRIKKNKKNNRKGLAAPK